jgi:Initiator Replication protein
MAKPKRDGRQEVIKNSAAIQIDNQITLLQRRTWNAFLFNAYNNLETEEEHCISLEDLARLIGYDSHDMEYLKEASRAMMRCIVEWDVLDKDGSPEWGATALLAQVKITRGMCTYAYSPELRRRLHNPAMYARLDLNLQKQFNSKYSLALWELCTDYLGSGREYGETPFIPIDTFRKLMGVTEKMYPAFMNFNQKVIKPAVDEINTVSDFRVAVDYQRQGRKVRALKFKMRRVTLLPEAVTAQKKLFPDLEDMPVIVKELRDVGLSTHDALEIWQQGFAYVDESLRPSEASEHADVAFVQYVREKIHLLKRRQVSGKVENSTGFLLKAIRQNYANPEFAQEQQREASAVRQQAKQVPEKLVKALEQQRVTIELARDRELDHLCSQVAAEVPDLLEQAASALLMEHIGFHQFYDRDKSALENFQTRKTVQAFLNPYLERHAPARFEAVKQHYAAQIASLSEHIAAVQSP